MSDNNLEETIEKAKEFDRNKKGGHYGPRPFYDVKWRRRDYESELCDNKQSIDDLVDELSRSKEDDNYLYGTRL